MRKRGVRGKHPFRSHRPDPRQVEQIEKLRSACERVYDLLLELPPNTWNERAIERLEEVSMWGNKGVIMAQEGPVAPPEPLPELGIEAPPELRAELERERMAEAERERINALGWAA